MTILASIVKMKHKAAYKKMFERAIRICAGSESVEGLKKQREEYISKYGIDQPEPVMQFQKLENTLHEVYVYLLPKWSKKAAKLGIDEEKYAEISHFCFENSAWPMVRSLMEGLARRRNARPEPK